MIKLSKEDKREHLKKYPLPDWCKKRRQASKSVKFCKTKEWKELREKVIKHYGAICMCCGSKEKIQVDHIKPKSKYPELSLEFNNLQVLCWGCNKNKNYIYEHDYRAIKCV